MGLKSEWEVFSLSDHIEIKHGFAFKGEYITKKETNNVLLTPGNFSIGGGFKSDKFKYYDTNEFPDEYILNENDLIVTMTDLSKAGDTLGYPAKVPATYGKNYLHNQRLGLIDFITTDLDKDFLYWLLRTRGYQKFIINSATGSTVKHTSPTRILEYSFNAPKDVQDQKKVANILTALENKIELNHKMNQTLEEVVQALFKSWFVDFDPVHAKTEVNSDDELDKVAKDLGISREVLDLFPSEFEENELGLIPKGWSFSKINEKLDVLLGGTPSRSNDSYWKDGVVSWINSGKVNEFRVIQPSEMITDQAVSDSSTKLLPKKTTLIAITGATLGQVSLLEIDSCANQSVIGLPETEELNHAFVYPCVCHIITDLISHQTGGAQQHINKGNVENYEIIIPKKSILSGYTDLVEPLMRLISNNTFEAQSLQETRDILLSKLLSGEIDVSKLELDNATH